MSNAGLAQQMFQSFQKMTIQKQVMECQELEARQRELQVQVKKIQSEKENQIRKILEQIKPEVRTLKYYFTVILRFLLDNYF